MSIYDSRATPLLEQFLSANEAEGVATRALLAYMQDGGTDENKLIELADRMTEAHEEKMRLFQELQQFRLDK